MSSFSVEEPDPKVELDKDSSSPPIEKEEDENIISIINRYITVKTEINSDLKFLLEEKPDISAPLPGIDNVYLIREWDTQYSKIGISKNPLETLKIFSLSNPHLLILIACCPGGSEVETAFKNKYKSDYIRDGWFTLDDDRFLEVVDEFRALRYGGSQIKERLINEVRETKLTSNPEVSKAKLTSNPEVEVVKIKVKSEFESKVKNKFEVSRTKTESKSTSDSEVEVEDEFESEDKKLMRVFLAMLPIESLEEESNWIKIGKVILQIEGPRGSTRFIKLSQRVYTERKCRRTWSNLEEGLPITALAWIAREYNEKAYNEWLHPQVAEAAEKACKEVNDLDVAQLLKRFFWMDFICTGLKSSKWLYYDGNEYKNMEADIKVRLAIADKLLPFLEKFRADLFRKEQSLPVRISSRNEREELDNKIVNMGKIIKLLKNGTNRNKIIRLSREFFYVGS
jgi:hypothetical protein